MNVYVQVSEYKQYQDALAEDEFFDEDQVTVVQNFKIIVLIWRRCANVQMSNHGKNICFNSFSTRGRRGWMDLRKIDLPPVSYTHLTLPTNREV